MLVPVMQISVPANVLPVPASRVAEAILLMQVLLVPFLFILVELPLELINVSHAYGAA